MSSQAKNMLRRVITGQHPWKEYTPNTLELDILKEYLRRHALWSKALRPGIWPLGDIAEAIENGFQAAMKQEFESEMEIFQIPMQAIETLWRCIKFYELLDKRDALSEFNLPNPYEPLILLFSKGRWFWKETGGLQFGIAFVSLSQGIDFFASRDAIDLTSARKDFEAL